MPMYQIQCTHETCSHEWEDFHGMREMDRVYACPICGAKGQRLIVAPKIGGRRWEGQEAKSLSLAFDPRAIKQLKQEVPSLELAPDGSAVFHSDRHQRQVYREINATMERYDREARDALSECGDRELATAAQAISGKFDVTDALAPMLAGASEDMDGVGDTHNNDGGDNGQR